MVANSATVAKDAHGRPLPHFPWGTRQLEAGELWLFSPYHRHAYDSRYFGPVLNTGVIAVLRPVWTAPVVWARDRPAGTELEAGREPSRAR